jgi:hypothetical protein
MKRFAAIVCAFAVVPVISARAGMVTMHTAQTDTGNQAYSTVGLQFTVNPGPGISVLQLGIYDSGQNGIAGSTATLSTVLFDATNAALAQVDFTEGDPGSLAGDYRFKSLGTALVLAPGSYTIVGYGFDGLNPEHNSNNGGTGPLFDGGAGLISFAKSVWGGGSDLPTVFPTSPGGYSQVPDYFDGPNMKFDTAVVPLPGAVLLGFLGLSAAGLKLRRFV